MKLVLSTHGMLKYLLVFIFICGSQLSFAQSSDAASAPTVAMRAKNPVIERAKKEEKIPPNYFAIAFYEPTYILPYYYTFSPPNSVYMGQAPDGERLKHNEFKYQLSFKVPVWQNILNHPISLYLAYSQMSYWQVYAPDAFFRETDYSPEVFLADEINFRLFKNWVVNFINIGAMHQSNGYGTSLERTWNRIYISAVISNDNWVITIKPWAILENGTYRRQNPDLAQFMGYGQVVVAYKYGHQVFSVSARNVIESGGRRSGITLGWSFPLTQYIKGYVQAYSGYGQSLIEYNHRTNSLGVGIALSDWV